MRSKLLTLLLLLLPVCLFSQNYEKEGDELYAQAQYEQAEKKYKAAAVIVGETLSLKQKQDKCAKCKSLLTKARSAENESRYNDAAKYYSNLYDIHPLTKYKSEENAMKQKINELEQERQAKLEAERRAEQERIAKQEEERVRLAKERAEKAQRAREQAEKERLAQERAEKERLARERAKAIERAEQERIAKARAEQEQLNREHNEQKRALREGRPAKGKCGDNITWEFYNGTLTISGKGEMDNFKGYRSSRYEKESPWQDLLFYSKIESVIISPNVTSIGDNAFRSCRALKTITIPSSVTSIGNSAFEYCENMHSLTIPQSVTNIGSYAFYGCKKLKLVVPKRFDTTSKITSFIFTDCKSVTYY